MPQGQQQNLTAPPLIPYGPDNNRDSRGDNGSSSLLSKTQMDVLELLVLEQGARLMLTELRQLLNVPPNRLRTALEWLAMRKIITQRPWRPESIDSDYGMSDSSERMLEVQTAVLTMPERPQQLFVSGSGQIRLLQGIHEARGQAVTLPVPGRRKHPDSQSLRRDVVTANSLITIRWLDIVESGPDERVVKLRPQAADSLEVLAAYLFAQDQA